MTELRTGTPYALVAACEPTVEATKRELVRLTRHLELEAHGGVARAVAATLQDERFLTDRTRAVYARLAERGAEVRLLARGLQAWLAPGVAGVALDDDDPLVDEWCVVVVGAQPVAFAATDLGAAEGADADRCFRYGISRDPQVVSACAAALGVDPGAGSGR